MKLIYISIVCLFFSTQTMVVDENVLSLSFSELFDEDEYVKLGNDISSEKGLALYDYCSVNETVGNYTFLGYVIEKLAVRTHDKNKLEEVLIKFKVPDGDQFYERMIKKYGMPDTSSISGYYLKKHGYRLPPEVEPDSLDNYYKELPKPTTEDFPALNSLTWYDLNKNTNKKVATDIMATNKTYPAKFSGEKEIWITFKRAKF